jgi:prevent-host-death family protein
MHEDAGRPLLRVVHPFRSPWTHGVTLHSISIREAQARLADLIDQVNAGQSVVITRRGRAVARLVPAIQADNPLPNRDVTRAAMVKRGARVSGNTVATMRTEARQVLRELQAQAKLSGTDTMTLDEINQEIAAARKERRGRRS